MLAMWVQVRVKPEMRQRFLRAIEADALGSERDESGCLRFNVLQDEADENVYYFYEVYRDEAALEAHRATPHYAIWRAAVDTLEGAHGDPVPDSLPGRHRLLGDRASTGDTLTLEAAGESPARPRAPAPPAQFAPGGGVGETAPRARAVPAQLFPGGGIGGRLRGRTRRLEAPRLRGSSVRCGEKRRGGGASV